MGPYWLPVLLGAAGIVALLALAAITLAHLRRWLRTLDRVRTGTLAQAAPVREAALTAASRLRVRRQAH